MTFFLKLNFRFLPRMNLSLFPCCSHFFGAQGIRETLVSFQFFNLGQSVGLLGRGISLSQGRYLHIHRITQTNIHALSGIRTHNPSFRAGENISLLRRCGHCDRPYDELCFIWMWYVVIMEEYVVPMEFDCRVLRRMFANKGSIKAC
jgi:hypothetical protein